ncbi:hypothetical protein OC835_004419 [Tilletia horrida]|nr:hypothetical protein OC835_004419 [Tilletia horrida]
MAPAGRGGRGGRGRAGVPYQGDEFKEKSTPAARAAALFKQAQQKQHAEATAHRKAHTQAKVSTGISAAIAKQEAVERAAAALSKGPARDEEAIPLQTLIKALSSSSSSPSSSAAEAASTTMEIRRAMSLAKALVHAGRATISTLVDMNKLVLTEIVGWPACAQDMKGKVGELEINKAVAACRRAAFELEEGGTQHGATSSPHFSPARKGAAQGSVSSSSSSPAKGYSWEGKREADDLQSYLDSHSHSSKRRKISQAEERLSREWGNPLLPLDSQGESVGQAGDAGEGEDGGPRLPEYEIPCILDEEQLRGRTALVNRAPVMTVWTMILLERMGFQRREALSLAQCYVSTTSTARAVTLGFTSASERDKASTVGPKQPHFVLMGVKLPVLQLQKRTATGDVGEYRAIYDGQVVEPQKAFDYIFRSFYQTLPYVFGSLVLLADSFLDPTGQDADADELHAAAWDLYCEFRPETGGEWGKRARLSCDTVLSLRKGLGAGLASGSAGTGAGGTSSASVKSEEGGGGSVAGTTNTSCGDTAQQQVDDAED